MSSPLQSSILRALFVALKPLARALLRAGVGYREFADVAKAAFIQEASTEFGLRGRPTNISRVAVMTGIARKEVKRIRDSDMAGFFDYTASISPAALILEAWHILPEYCNKAGAPLILHYDSGPVSFSSLVKQYAGDIPAGAMRSELIRVGAINELPDRRIEVLKRHFIPSGLDDRLVIGMEDVLAADLSTLAYNCNPKRQGQTRYHRVTSIEAFSGNDLAIVQSEATKRLMDFALSFDDFLNQQRNSSIKNNLLQSKEANTNVEAGVGLFYFERKKQ